MSEARHVDSIKIWQEIVGATVTGHWVDGDETTVRTREWQAKHLPDLPEVHRGYLTREGWDKARELGYCVGTRT